MTRIPTLSIVVLALAAGGCQRTVYIERESVLQLPATGIERLDIETRNGAVTVRTDSTLDHIHVAIHQRVGGRTTADAEAAADSLQVLTPSQDGIQTLRWEWAAPASSWSARLSYDVRVPHAVAADIDTRNGPIDVAGLRGQSRLDTRNGRVEVADHDGPLEIESRNGTITVQHHGPRVSCVTHNGRMTVATSAPQVMLDSHNGAIEADLSGGAAVDGQISTRNGAVTLRLASTASTTLDCKTHNGRVTLDDLALSDERRDDGVLHGRLGAGTGQLTIRTHNGAVRIDRLP